MIFFTLGTHQPFDRLVHMVDQWCGQNPDAEVFGQLPEPGRDGYKPRHFPWVTQLHPDEYQRTVDEAKFLVAHAGMGSIITALCRSKPIVIFPRRAALKEQRNDHQLATANRFLARPGVHVAFDETQLVAALDRLHTSPDVASEGPPLSPFADPRLTDQLRNAIMSSGHRARRSRATRPETPGFEPTRDVVPGH